MTVRSVTVLGRVNAVRTRLEAGELGRRIGRGVHLHGVAVHDPRHGPGMVRGQGGTWKKQERKGEKGYGIFTLRPSGTRYDASSLRFLFRIWSHYKRAFRSRDSGSNS